MMRVKLKIIWLKERDKKKNLTDCYRTTCLFLIIKDRRPGLIRIDLFYIDWRVRMDDKLKPSILKELHPGRRP